MTLCQPTLSLALYWAILCLTHAICADHISRIQVTAGVNGSVDDRMLTMCQLLADKLSHVGSDRSYSQH